MRLLLIVPKLISYRGFLRELSLSLVADGVEVHVACSREKMWGQSDRIPDEGVQIHGIDFPRGMNPSSHLQAARALRQLIADIEPDIVHAHFSAAIFTTALARKKGWPPTYATFHGVSFLASRGWKAAALARAEKWAARQFNAVWVLTEDDRAGLRVAVPKAIVHRLPGYGLGCDLERFAPLSPDRREAVRAAMGIERDDVVFTFLGRFVEFKGFALVVRAFLQLRQTNQRCGLLLIGIRDRLHPTGLSDEEEKVLTASNGVIDLGFRTDVENCLPAADVMVFPSRREGMPVCLMEALVLGIPAITSDTRGCREVVRDRVDGLVLREPTVDSLRAAMELAAGDKTLRADWSAAAIAGRERFSRDHFISAQKRIYETAVSPSPMVQPFTVAA
jgi:glycosyltransferase involved in cell wall biosynthesis